MAIHYCASQEAVACGRTGASLTSTQDLSQVSCKLCLRSVEKGAAEPVRKTPSLAELRAAAKAAKAVPAEAQNQPAPVAAEHQSAPVAYVAAAAPVKPASAAVSMPAVRAPASAPEAETKPGKALSPRAEWQQRLQQMPGRNRLPRGAAKQGFI